MNKLNCVPGDIAIVIKADVKENLGKIVTCKTNIGTPSNMDTRYPRGKNLWLIDQQLEWKNAFGITVFYPYVPDECLKPLRYSDDTDEHDILVRQKVRPTDAAIF